MLIRLLVVAVLVLILWLGTRRMKVVPGRPQAALEDSSSASCATAS